MSLEPEIAAMALEPARTVDWRAYRRCTTCGALAGQPCEAMYARITDGRPNGGPVQLHVPHVARTRKRGW